MDALFGHRQQCGETPQYLYAQKLGISKSSLNRIENEDQNVSLEMLEKLCRRLKCDVGDLFRV